MDKPFTGVLTLGYDPEAAQYVGTWIDSMGSHLWKYEGEVDASGRILTLETQGPCPTAPGKVSNFRETLEIKDPNHRVFTSAMQDDEGNWNTMVTVNYHRKS
jgi:hypothetical protein